MNSLLDDQTAQEFLSRLVVERWLGMTMESRGPHRFDANVVLLLQDETLSEILPRMRPSLPGARKGDGVARVVRCQKIPPTVRPRTFRVDGAWS
ncbi:MAG: hypothetical protein JSV80_05800 [Acidobacteriota bacterium]|nr:MAG: hypothetical protein JSV80_05800 [Acidobacteriota bacterium]